MLKHMPPGPPGGHQLHHQNQIPQPQQRPVVSGVTTGPSSSSNNTNSTSLANNNNNSRSSLLIRSPNHHQQQQPLNVLTLTSPTTGKPIANGGPRLTSLLLANSTAPTTPTNIATTNIYGHHQQHNQNTNSNHQFYNSNHHNYSNCNNLNSTALPNIKHRIGAREATTSLGLLCLGKNLVISHEEVSSLTLIVTSHELP